MRDNNGGKGILTFLLGAGIGVVIGLFTAPRSGKETLQILEDEYEKTKHNLEESANEKLREAKTLINDTVDKYTPDTSEKEA